MFCVLHRIIDDAIKLLVQDIRRIHTIVHAAVHVAYNLLEFQTHVHLLRPPVPSVEDGVLSGSEGVPIGVFELEHNRGEGDGNEHVEDTTRRDMYCGEGSNCNIVHELRLERLKSRLWVPWRLHIVAVKFDLLLVSRTKLFIKIGKGFYQNIVLGPVLVGCSRTGHVWGKIATRNIMLVCNSCSCLLGSSCSCYCTCFLF